MNRVRLSNPVTNDFGMVPRAVWRVALPSSAKLLLAYFYSLPHGTAINVAETEEATGLGREARRKGLAACEAAGFVAYVVDRNAKGQAMGRTLVLHLDVLLEADRVRQTGNQAVGQMAENRTDGDRQPENPSVGVPVVSGADIRPDSDGKLASNLRERDRKSAARSRVAAARAAKVAKAALEAGPPSFDPRRLSAFQRSQVLAGDKVLFEGRYIVPGSREFEGLRLALRSGR